MSTYQPPGEQPPEGTPPYAQPQDPWAGGYEQGVASVPTDPIPQNYDPYASGSPPGEVWSQQTVAHGGPYGYVPQPPPRSKAGLFIIVFLAVLVLGGGGGYTAWYLIKNPPNVDPNAGPTTSGQTTTPPQTSSAPPAFDPYAVQVGDCLINKGTNAAPDLQISPCATPKSFKVIKISRGVEIPGGLLPGFNGSTVAENACKGTGFTNWYAYNTVDDAGDRFFCMTTNP